ncbi:MAG: DUF2889 domain-containing protein [Candidatus Protistobacter heckmanni]|nr:DUF2889 domain-containing protein [Candidatus Protistobacter heckmanni]
MPLNPTVSRIPLHTRSITIQGYRREDGLYDIEGRLTDVKTRDIPLATGIRKAGDNIHEMWLRITVDNKLNIIDAEASSDAVPYAGHCGNITPAYKQLIGLSLRPGFSAKVRKIFGGIEGCTHITELIGSLATTAYQTMAGEGHRPENQRPFQLDGCHALRIDGPAVQEFYPKWYDPKREGAGSA